MIKNIIVFGAGAIGGLYGAILSERNNVILIGRKDHTDKINTRGLFVKGIVTDNFKIRTLTQLESIKERTLVVVTTKIYDQKRALEQILNKSQKDTIILSIHNGIDESLSRFCKENGVLKGITTYEVNFLTPGHLEYNKEGITIIEDSPYSGEIREVFMNSGIKTTISPNIEYDAWKKLVINCMINPITAILEIETNQLLNNNLYEIQKEIYAECIKILGVKGFYFQENLLERLSKKIKFYNTNSQSSMRQDILKRKKTEIDYINGIIVRYGKEYGIPTPVNQAILNLVKYKEKQYIKTKERQYDTNNKE